MASAAKKAHFISGMLIFGTCTSIMMKVQLVMMCTGFGGITHTFDKPFFQSIAMFLSMLLALPTNELISYIKRRTSKTASSSSSSSSSPVSTEKSPLLPDEAIINDSEGAKAAAITGGAEDAAHPKKHKNPLIIMVPAAFDLIASTIMTFGLIYISVSIFQMLRGSMVIFSTILTRIFLKGRRVRRYQLLGVVLAVIAICLVGTAGVLVPQANMTAGIGKTVFGIVLVILSQVIQAGQIVVEEFLLADLNMPPLRVVGFEGLWGLLLMVVVACPLAYVIPGKDFSPMPQNSLENTYDSFICLGSNTNLIWAVVVFCLAVLFYNCYGMLITDSFSAVNRTIFEAVRTAVIWIVDLIIQAIFPGSPFGELWSKWSALELVGFIILVFSTLVYNRVIVLPLPLDYEKDIIKQATPESEEAPEEAEAEEEVETTTTPTTESQ